MNWPDITTDLDTYFDDISEPTDEELQMIEDEWMDRLDDDDVPIPEDVLELLWQMVMRDEE